MVVGSTGQRYLKVKCEDTCSAHVSWAFVELNSCLLLCYIYFACRIVQYLFEVLLKASRQAVDDGDLKDVAEFDEEAGITDDDGEGPASIAESTMGEPLLDSERSGKKSKSSKAGQIMSDLGKRWSAFYQRNIVRLSVIRDTMVWLKVAVSGGAIVYFMKPTGAVACGAVSFDYQYAYNVTQSVRGNVHHNKTNGTSCFRPLVNRSSEVVNHPAFAYSANRVQHDHCKPELHSYPAILTFLVLLAVNQAVFVVCILFKYCIVHHQLPALRPFFVRNARMLCLLLPTLAFVLALGKAAAVFWVHATPVTVSISPIDINTLMQQQFKSIMAMKVQPPHTGPRCLKVEPAQEAGMIQTGASSQQGGCEGWEMDCANNCHADISRTVRY
jgi:hypothetical protein